MKALRSGDGRLLKTRNVDIVRQRKNDRPWRQKGGLKEKEDEVETERDNSGEKQYPSCHEELFNVEDLPGQCCALRAVSIFLILLSWTGELNVWEIRIKDLGLDYRTFDIEWTNVKKSKKEQGELQTENQ